MDQTITRSAILFCFCYLAVFEVLVDVKGPHMTEDCPQFHATDVSVGHEVRVHYSDLNARFQVAVIESKCK